VWGGSAEVLRRHMQVRRRYSDLKNRDVIKDDLDENYRPDVRGRRSDVHPRPYLPRGCDFTRGRVFTVRGRVNASPRTWGVRADASTPRLRGHRSPRTHPCIRADARKKN
jgi:hypothetical protein